MFFIKEDSICYEVGTSVGELLTRLTEHSKGKKNVNWIGIEENMIKNARQILKGTKNASLEVADVVLYDFDFSELIAAYYTVQFTFPEFRQEVISKIYLALN